MGLFSKIGKALGKVGQAIGKVAKGVVKFAKSPIGKFLINVGIGVLTGGTGSLLTKGLGMLGKLPKLGKLVSTFKGFATKFLGKASSLLSKSGLQSLSGFLKNARSSGDLASMAKDLFSARKAAPQTDATTTAAADQNALRLFAQRQAQLLGN